MYSLYQRRLHSGKGSRVRIITKNWHSRDEGI
jgi:hypothetical protein